MVDADAREGLLTVLADEEVLLTDLLPRFSDEQWRDAKREDGWTVHDIAMHLADSTYGLALLSLGEVQPNRPLNQATGWMEVDDYNEQRRQKNATLSRDKVMSRTAGAFQHARRAIQAVHDFDAPGPYGAAHTQGQWVRRMVDHVTSHRVELEQMLASDTVEP